MHHPGGQCSDSTQIKTRKILYRLPLSSPDLQLRSRLSVLSSPSQLTCDPFLKAAPQTYNEQSGIYLFHALYYQRLSRDNDAETGIAHSGQEIMIYLCIDYWGAGVACEVALRLFW